MGNKSAPPVAGDEYVARLYHALRNTHHGYQLERQQQLDILDSSGGHISAAFPELVVLYVLAMTADPVAALSGSWLDP